MAFFMDNRLPMFTTTTKITGKDTHCWISFVALITIDVSKQANKRTSKQASGGAFVYSLAHFLAQSLTAYFSFTFKVLSCLPYILYTLCVCVCLCRIRSTTILYVRFAKAETVPMIKIQYIQRRTHTHTSEHNMLVLYLFLAFHLFCALFAMSHNLRHDEKYIYVRQSTNRLCRKKKKWKHIIKCVCMRNGMEWNGRRCTNC